jgi:hypothetical protein
MKKINVICFSTALLGMSFSVLSQQVTSPVFPNAVAQCQNLNCASNEEFQTLRGNEFEWSKVMGVLYQFDDIRFGKIATDGSQLLFDEMQDNTSIYLDSVKLILNDVNYHIKKDQFFTKSDHDSVFVFDFNYVKKIEIANSTFNKYANYNQYNTGVYEVLVESKNLSLLKKYKVQLISASPNPMVNRPRNKIQKKKEYYLRTSEGKMTAVRMSKPSILKAMGKENQAKLKKIIAENKLKLRKEKDVIRLFQIFETTK